MTLKYDGSDIEMGRCYYLESGTLFGLLQIASKLSSGDYIDADMRRDMAQWMQARLIQLIVTPDMYTTDNDPGGNRAAGFF
jgi:hypothetical protein